MSAGLDALRRGLVDVIDGEWQGGESDGQIADRMIEVFLTLAPPPAGLDVVERYLREREAVLQGKGDRSAATLRDSWMGADTTNRDLAVEAMLLAFVRQAILAAEATPEQGGVARATDRAE